MSAAPDPAGGRVGYILKRYPRLSETFILNEIRAMERLGEELELFSLLPPEPPPWHPMVSEVQAEVSFLPPAWGKKLAALASGHAAALRAAPLRYTGALGRALVWAALSPHPLATMKQFLRAGFVAAVCRQKGVSRIHAHFANAPAAVGLFASRMLGVPFSFTTHAKDLYLTPRRVMQKRIAAARFVTTCTDYNARYLRAMVAEGERHKIHLVYHGIDLSQFDFRDAAETARLDGLRPVILSVGRLVPKKGLGDLIAACALLRERGAGFRCIIVGEGPLRAALEADIRDRGLAGWVTLQGAMTHARLIHLYREAQVFALPSRVTEDGDRDGIPNVIAEAMAIGVPVVSTTVSGIPELVKEGETGLLVAPNDPQSLADAIAHLLGDPALCRHIAGQARRVLDGCFNCWVTARSLQGLMNGRACEAVMPPLAAPQEVPPQELAA